MTVSAPLTVPIVRDRLFIGGRWVQPAGASVIDVVGAPSEAVLGTVPEGGVADVDAAVRAAAAALPGWSVTSVEARAVALEALAAALESREDEIATVIALEVGMPLRLARQIQARLPVTDLRTAASELRELRLEEILGNSLVVREPVGVVAAITPWNYPLHQATAKLGGALAAGCTVVLKPSEVAPFSAFILAECVEAAGLPPGTVNVVTGYGQVVGEALAGHPLVDMVSFTGSTRAGRRVAEIAAATVKRVALELGGKSAAIVLDDADLSRAVPAVVNACMLNSGQTCTALTRLLVPNDRLEDALEIAVAAVGKLTVGPPLEEGTRLGPLASGAQRERVRDLIATGIAEGARLVVGGVEPPDGLGTGFYVQATILAGMAPDARVAQEEIFGPVLCVLGFASEDEAVDIANGTPYGLAAAVWSGDPERAQRVARRLRAGQVDVNGGRFNPRAPFGGYKQSGVGRELGRFGIEEFLETKALQLP